MEDESYILIIEWDGAKPPSKWYHRLSRLGLTAAGRGSKDEGVIARRESDAGVTHQEGAIICVRESTARSLAHVATELGAKAVTVARLEVQELSMTPEDQAAMERITRSLGRRGRLAKNEATDWVVTCRDEARTYQLENHREPGYCPKCASFNVTIHSGFRATASYPQITNDLDIWEKTRFITGGFEVPIIIEDAAPANGEAFEASDAITVKKLRNSTLAKQVAHLNFEYQFHILDLGFINLKLDQDERLTRRIRGITDFIAKGGDPIKFPLVCDQDDVSLIDIYDQDRKDIFNLIAYRENANA